MLARPRADVFNPPLGCDFLNQCRECRVLLLLCLLIVGLSLFFLLCPSSPAPFVHKSVANQALLMHVPTLLERAATSACASACTCAQTSLTVFFSALMPCQQLSSRSFFQECHDYVLDFAERATPFGVPHPPPHRVLRAHCETHALWAKPMRLGKTLSDAMKINEIKVSALWLFFALNLRRDPSLLAWHPVVLFRPIVKQSEPVQVSTLLERSEDFTDSLVRRASKMRDAATDAAVWEATLKDVKNKFLDKPVVLRFFKKLFGPGGWPPLPRFPIKQGNKRRLIDDAKASGTKIEGKPFCTFQDHDYVLDFAERAAPFGVPHPPLDRVLKAHCETHALWSKSMRPAKTLSDAMKINESKVSALWLFTCENENSAAQRERRMHTTSLDFITQLCFWLRAVWMSALSESHPHRTMDGGMNDETSAFGSSRPARRPP
jgi:hypothetical protein